MARPTINGAPVLEGEGWVVLRRKWDDTEWWPMEFTFAATRQEAIDKILPRFWYDRCRRRGEMIAVHCVLQPICVPETAGDADRRVEVTDG